MTRCIENYNIKSSKCEKLLGIIKIENKLNFDNPVDEICKKAEQKLCNFTKSNTHHVILTVRRDVYSLIYFRVIHFLTG